MKFKAIFLRNVNINSKVVGNKVVQANPNYIEVGEVDFKPEDETINFKGKPLSYMVRLESDSFTDRKGTKIYYYDIDSIEPIGIKAKLKDSNMTPEDLNIFTGRKVVQNIVAGIKEKSSAMGWFSLLFPVITLIVGVVIGHFVMPEVILIPVGTIPNTPSV